MLNLKIIRNYARSRKILTNPGPMLRETIAGFLKAVFPILTLNHQTAEEISHPPVQKIDRKDFSLCNEILSQQIKSRKEIIERHRNKRLDNSFGNIACSIIFELVN